MGKVARAKGECWLCAQRGISKPNKGKGRCRTAHCDSCRRWLRGARGAPQIGAFPCTGPVGQYVAPRQLCGVVGPPGTVRSSRSGCGSGNVDTTAQRPAEWPVLPFFGAFVR